jgi:cell division protein ZipA
MSELRWVLIALGAVVIGLTWALSSGRVFHALSRLWGSTRRTADPEPLTDDSADDDSDADTAAGAAVDVHLQQSHGAPIDRVVTVRFFPRAESLNAEEALLALRAAGLRLGDYGVFHMYADEDERDTLFMVSNLTEPGSFELSNLAEATIPGMNFFLVLPGTGDPVERFDRMVDTARSLARSLDAELRDERGSSWSIQRERYVREEIIAYRHQMEGRA